tara:strand:- start:135 stop:455 length:321 start_codon:yes stop_codon:yes gene_type:complete
MTNYNWDYSEHSDILHVQQKDQPTKGSVELGDFTLDFGSNEEIIGIEIEHASEFFGNMDIDKNFLKGIQEAELTIDKRNHQCQLLFLKLKVGDSVKKISLPTPVIA